MDFMDWLKAGLGAAVGMVLAALIGAWRKPSSHAELIKEAVQAARGVVADVREEVADLKLGNGLLRNRVTELEARSLQCEGENRQLWQYVDSLKSVLRRHGITIPSREMPGSFVVLEGDHATVMTPDPAKPEE